MPPIIAAFRGPTLLPKKSVDIVAPKVNCVIESIRLIQNLKYFIAFVSLLKSISN